MDKKIELSAGEKAICYGDTKEMGRRELASMGAGIPNPPATIGNQSKTPKPDAAALGAANAGGEIDAV